MSINNSLLIFNFNKDCDSSNWNVVDDRVMGGRSGGSFYVDKEGNGVFEGFVSLQNNGGFSSVKYSFKTKKTEDYHKIIIRLRGDGKRYQIRIKSNKDDQHSYIKYINTTEDWQLIEISLNEMYPTFRGRKLDLPNYPRKTLEEVAFLIGNKVAENFRLEIDSIVLR